MSLSKTNILYILLPVQNAVKFYGYRRLMISEIVIYPYPLAYFKYSSSHYNIEVFIYYK